MVALQLPAPALGAIVLTLFNATPVLAAPTEFLERRGYDSFSGFTRITDGAALSWYEPYAATGVNHAVVANPPGYKCFYGQSANLPYVTGWKNFDTLWAINLPMLRGYNSEANNKILREKILQIAAETKTDARMILSMIIQESGGKLDVRCTGDNNVNCGIMQAAPGSVPFNLSNPAASIDTMIRNGALGTPGSWPRGGPGYAWLFNGADGQSWFNLGGSGKPYRSLRAYNTGKVPNQGNLDAMGGAGMVSYVNDIANRLIGWSGKNRGCGYSY